ncbi:hypothetical protein FBEOM_10667 [Fusarium beomiforme]|uniref:Uncharacterized protein n=1 Tax=Fusarium beomiforme TaxID=44412 RepID=A0A9P5AAX0_9HYPO|nr:hypothetical protein FBEOM_10667 [Fusarium beomiforme]
MAMLREVAALWVVFLAGNSQASLLSDTHLFKRYPPAYEVPSATHLTTTVLSGNGGTNRTSVHILFPTSTHQLVDRTTTFSPVILESTALSSITSTDGDTDDGTSEAFSQVTGRVSVPSPGSQDTSTTSIEVNWTGLLPVTPSITAGSSIMVGSSVTEPNITTDAGASIDSDIDKAIEVTSRGNTVPDTSIFTSEISTGFPEITETTESISETSGPGTGNNTVLFPGNPPPTSPDSETLQSTTFPETTTGTADTEFTTGRSYEDPGSLSPSSAGSDVSDATSQTPETTFPTTELASTGTEGPGSAKNSSVTSEPSDTPRSPSEVTKSYPESLTNERPSRISKVPETTDDPASSITATQNGVVTGTDGTVATYVPEQYKEYISSTGTTTTTDDNGAAIVIFPFGWFWKLDGGRGGGVGGGVAKPPPPTANPVPENEPEDKDGDDDEDNDSSTKEDKRTTAASTIHSTTQEPTSTFTTEETTTSGECTAATQPDCTRTISYMTSDGTQIMTEFGECPTIISCATETQATTTVTLTPEFIWAGVPDTNPVGVIPEDAYTADVDPDIVAALEAEWAEIFGDDGYNETETTSLLDATASEDSTTVSRASTETGTYLTTDESTTVTSTKSTSNTETAATVTTDSESPFTTSVPSTLITKTKGSSDTSGMLTSSDEEATRTNYPCVIYGGPAVETPYCQCSTTVNGEEYYATTTLIDDRCVAYTEFPAKITSASDTGPMTNEPVQQPITTTTDGTVLVWSAYVLGYVNIPGITKITQTVGYGEPSTVSTPLPSQTAVDNDGGGQCGTADGLSKKGLREACDRAINQFEDDTVYTGYASRFSRSKKGILVAASVGQAACIAKFQCDDYGIGMRGSAIKEARESEKENDGVDICGHIRLSNSCTIIMDYCTNCKTRG